MFGYLIGLGRGQSTQESSKGKDLKVRGGILFSSLLFPTSLTPQKNQCEQVSGYIYHAAEDGLACLPKRGPPPSVQVVIRLPVRRQLGVLKESALPVQMPHYRARPVRARFPVV